MNEILFETPILFLIFNRPDTTQQVFDQIKKIKPAILYIGADGPRENKEGEAELCQQTRDIIQQIDWECELRTLFRERNLGCADAVRFAIDWFFENVEWGIILEDDCVPNVDFFKYCQDLLIKYHHDDQVMMISGSNPLPYTHNRKPSIYFSRTALCWGWATWKRAWNKYDYSLSKWLEYYPIFFRDNYYNSMNEYREEMIYLFNQLYYSNFLDTWDYQWLYTMIINNGISIIPSKNLIMNIGALGAHATGEINKNMYIPQENLDFPLHYPDIIDVDKQNDQKLMLLIAKRSIQYYLALKLAMTLRKYGYFPRFETFHPLKIGYNINKYLKK